MEYSAESWSDRPTTIKRVTPREPNLFLVGSMRSGTTALHELLSSHGQIFMSEFKEPAYFTDPAELAADSRIVFEAGYSGNLRSYLSLFDAATDEIYVGESSTHYTKLPRITGVADRIYATTPDARILYLVRDPVDRTVSHYRFAVKRKTERRGMLHALRDNPFYVSVSNYALQLRQYLETFGDDQVRVVVLEELIAKPDHVLNQLTAWLGIERFEDPRLPVRNAVPTSLMRARGPQLLHRLGHSHRYQELASKWLPEGLRRWVRATLTRPVFHEELIDDDVVSYLRSVLDPTIEELAILTGRSYEIWSNPEPSDSSPGPNND